MYLARWNLVRKNDLWTMTHMSDDYVLEKLSEQEYDDLLDGTLKL